MKPGRSPLWQAAPVRALAESWLVCAVMLVPLSPVVWDAPPLARSLYLVQAPLVCAVIAALRMRIPSARNKSFPSIMLAMLRECGLALLLSLGIFGMVFGLATAMARLDAIRYSYAGTWGTAAFIWMAAPEYLGVRLLSLLWQRWSRLRRRRVVWEFTDAIIRVAGVIGLLALAGVILNFVRIFKNDIWGIPPDSFFAQAVFWLTMAILSAAVLVFVGALLFLPPAVLFSFRAARKMTARIEKLAEVTQALHQGDLATRVDVQGEDEIAQLQTDFNAMAADLEKSIQALQVEKDKVVALLEARRALVAGVSHELRNPVATILGYSDSLHRDWKKRSPEEIERDLGTLQYEASRLQTILNDLLTESQVDGGHLRVALEAVEVAGLTQRLVETLAGLAWTSKRVQVTLSAPPQPVIALADRLRLEQALVNLVQNAVRHTSPGGLVALEVQQNGDRICIEVEDTGEGISAADLPHIWEKYYQVGSPQRHTDYGAGLGLSLVKELTEAMGGTVSAASWPGQGSLFKIHLPACAPEEKPS